MKDIKSYLDDIRELESKIKKNPDDYDLYRLMGNICLEKLNSPLKALEYFMNYNYHNPNNWEICNKIGHLLHELDEARNVKDQIEFFERAHKLNPNERAIKINLALVYPNDNRDKDAMDMYENILRTGASMDSYFDYACLLLKNKQWKKGWEYFEKRFSKEHGATPRRWKVDKPLWKKQNIKNKTLLVHWEQGFGDTIMFCRYIPRLKSRCKKLIFVVQSPIVNLIEENFPDIKVVSDSYDLNKLDYDYYLPLMSCMDRLKEKPETIPNPEGYLLPSKGLKEFYKEKYFDNNKIKIGISWEGAKGGNKRRNIPIETFKQLTELEGVQVYSFQKDCNIPEDMNIVDLGSTFNNFDDTAGAMSNIDVFITGDNVLFNLAGALGIKTACMLNKYSEWRWFDTDNKCSWYSSARIFKKEKESDSWNSLMNRIMEEI